MAMIATSTVGIALLLLTGTIALSVAAGPYAWITRSGFFRLLVLALQVLCWIPRTLAWVLIRRKARSSYPLPRGTTIRSSRSRTSDDRLF